MEKEFKYNLFFNSTSCASIILKVGKDRFEVTDANKAYLKVCNFKLADITGKDYFDIFPVNPYICSDEWKKCFESVLSQKKEVKLGIKKLVYPLNSKTTFLDLRYYEIHHLPILGTEGNVEYIVRSLTEVTQQVIQEELYQESQASVEYGHWSLDSKHNVLQLSTGLKDILKIPPDFQPSIKSISQFYRSKKEERSFYKAVCQAIAEKRMFKTVIPILTARRDKCQLLIIGKPILIEDMYIGIRGVAKNITEKLSYISHIQNQHNNLRDIAFAQCHLVRAPLARILALSQRLKYRFSEENHDTCLLEALEHSAKELDDVIHDIIKKTVLEEMLIIDQKK